MDTERSSKALHNFTMPCELRWGNKKHLRCMKVNSGGRITPPLRRHASYTSDQRHRRNLAQHRRTGGEEKGDGEGGSSSFEFVHGSKKSGGGRRFSDVDDGIAAVREKLMLDLQTAADRMRDSIFKDEAEEIEVSGSPPAIRCVSSVDGENGGADGLAAGPDSGVSQTRGAGAEISMRLRSGGGVAAANGQKKGMPKFAVGLSKREVEEDFFGMVGRRPPRRPKKRTRNVQRQIDTLFPGLWLKEVTSHMYKVYEATM